MAPRDHRIHLGRRDSLKTPPQNHSSTKQLFSGPFVAPKRSPSQKCRPQIFPEADFGNFSKSLQKVRTANPSENLSRFRPKNPKRSHGVKNTFLVFCHAKINSLVLETQHLRIIFGILDPPGMSGVRNPTFTNYFWDFGPTWDVWCQKPNIYELFL